MEHIQWILSGIGTELLTLVIGAVVGGFTGYKIGVKKNYKQSQKAGTGAKQKQEVTDESNIPYSDNNKEITTINQKQKAGKNAEQLQIGRVRNGR